MATLRALVTLNATSGLPEDNVTNTFYFNGDPTGPVMTALTAALDTFYTDLQNWLSTRLTGAGSVRFYNMDESTPRVPLGEYAISFVPLAGSVPLPAEVAVVLSFQAQKLSGAIQAHRRGRVYIGPLNVNALSPAGQEARVAALLQSSLISRAGDLKAAALAASAPWVVYSQTLELAFDVKNGWIDNAFDTQRRRGVRSSLRSTWGPA